MTTDTRDAGDGSARGDAADVPVIDRAMGLAYVGGNQAMYARLLVKFGDTRAKDAETIRNLLAAGDRVGAERTAHSLKGVGATLGLVRTREMARALEVAIRDGADAAALADAIAAVATALEVTIAAIADSRPPAAPGA